MVASRLSICVISSPVQSHPSLYLISSLLSSLSLLPEITHEIELIFILDGYTIADYNRPKKGKITIETEQLYVQYEIALNEYLAASPWTQFTIKKLSTHHGFALAVKEGLLMCKTDYCLICQHDRIFCEGYQSVGRVLQLMDQYHHIRYVGFPTSHADSHNSIIQTRYRLECLNDGDMIIPVNDETSYLQPLIFWYDSQHIAHVQRYLDIFQPYKSLPKHLMDLFGKNTIGEMHLRPGDFIEDRFGQRQRKNLTNLSRKVSNDEIKDAFRWYGSYFIWLPDTPYEVLEDEPVYHSDGSVESLGRLYHYRAKIMITHLAGRTLDIERENRYENLRNKIRSQGGGSSGTEGGSGSSGEEGSDTIINEDSYLDMINAG